MIYGAYTLESLKRTDEKMFFTKYYIIIFYIEIIAIIMRMKETEKKPNIEDDSMEYTIDNTPEACSNDLLENHSNVSRSEETITLNSSFSSLLNIESQQTHNEEKSSNQKKFTDISDFLDNRMKKNYDERNEDGVNLDSRGDECKIKENKRLSMKNQDPTVLIMDQINTNISYRRNLPSVVELHASDYKNTAFNDDRSLNTEMYNEESEPEKQKDNFEKKVTKHTTERIIYSDKSEKLDEKGEVYNKNKTLKHKKGAEIVEPDKDSNEIIEPNNIQPNTLSSRENIGLCEIKDDSKPITKNKTNHLIDNFETKTSSDNLILPKPVIHNHEPFKTTISTNSIVENNNQFENTPKHQQIENELQKLNISETLDAPTNEVQHKNKSKVASIYDLLNSNKSTLKNTDPFAFLKKPSLEESNTSQSKSNINEELNMENEIKQTPEFSEIAQSIKTSKNFTIIGTKENITSKQAPIKASMPLSAKVLRSGINSPPKNFYKLNTLNSDVENKEYHKTNSKSMASEMLSKPCIKTEPRLMENVLKKKYENENIKRIPLQVHLHKNTDPNAVIFGQTLKSYYSDIPHNCQLIKFTEKYFKAQNYTEGSPENYVKLLYSNNLGLEGSLRNIILKESEINSVFLVPDCSFLMARFFIELINVLSKTGDIKDLEIFEEFVKKNINAEFKFLFILFFNFLLGNFMQTPVEKNTNIKFDGFLSLTVSLMDLLKKDIKILSLYALQITKYIENTHSSYIPFVLFLFYKRYNINIFSFFTIYLLKEELYTSILIYENIQLHKKLCVDNFLFSLVEIKKLSMISNWDILVNNRVHKECETCLIAFLNWKYTLLGKNDEFMKLKDNTNIISSIFKSFSSAIIGVSDNKTMEENTESVAKFEIAENTKSTVPSYTCNSQQEAEKKEIKHEANKTDLEGQIEQDDGKESIKGDTETKAGKTNENKGIFSSLSTLIFGKPTEETTYLNKEEKSSSIFNFLSSNNKSKQTFKVKPQDTQYVYDKEKEEWVSTRKIDRKKKHEEYMKNLQKERNLKPTTLPSKPIEFKKEEIDNLSLNESKYPQKSNKFSTPIKKINIPQSKRLKSLIKAQSKDYEFFNAPIKIKGTKAEEDVNEGLKISLEKQIPENHESYKPENSKTESINDFDQI